MLSPIDVADDRPEHGVELVGPRHAVDARHRHDALDPRPLLVGQAELLVLQVRLVGGDSAARCPPAEWPARMMRSGSPPYFSIFLTVQA